MILDAIVDDTLYRLTVPDTLIGQAEDYFSALDRDMDRGWQMGREWVERPTPEQRCQIVADKLLTALETENDQLGRLTAAYLLRRLPGLTTVVLDITGEIQNTRFRFADAATPAGTAPTKAWPAGLDRLAAVAQAGREVTRVFKVGKGYRFSVYDAARAVWEESPLIATQEEAERLRQLAFKTRFEALQQDGPA